MTSDIELLQREKIRLVALPCLCVDVFEGTDELRAGGEALNFAAHASLFEEIQVFLMGAVGQDAYADCIMSAIQGRAIDTSYVRIEADKTTANNRTYLTKDGDRYYKEDSWSGDIVDHMLLKKEELDFIAQADVVFVHFWAGCFRQILELRKISQFKLAVDFDIYRDFADMESYAPYIDYFMISGEEKLLNYFEDFSKKYPGLFNMTLAEQGSVTYHHGAKYIAPATKVSAIVDTTGCGDSYHAGLVCSHMLQGDIMKAMRAGAKLAAETLSHYGGF